MPTGLNFTQRLRQSTEPGMRAEEEAQRLAAQPPAAAEGMTPEQQQQTMDWLTQATQSGMFSADNIAGAAQTQADQARATQAAQAAQAAQEAQVNATNDRYGTDLSWLDPSLQYQAAQLGQSAGSQASADPNSVAAQNAAMTQAQQFASRNLQFQGPAAQQALSGQWAGIQAGQGAPQFMGGAQQQQMMNQLMGVRAPQYSGDADQRAVLNQALGMSTNTGPGSLAFDTSGRQGEQYGNLQGIIAGGGATAIEMADRARQRADSESWLRGQREADMSDYAERGLTGSGMELLNLSSDRQAAAGRNSLADLETAKALEERRLGAINSAAGLATNMRGQTIDEQGLLNTRATSGLGAASNVANSMRDANITEQNFLNTSARDQAVQGANIAETMRNQGYNEQTYLDKRMLDALGQQTDLQTKMRDQQANESIANSNAQQAGLNTFANTATNARNSSAQESQYRATAADDFAQLNQSAVNNAASANAAALQSGYQQMMNNRLMWETANANRNANAASGLYGSDVQENIAAANQGTNVGTQTANQFNNAQQNYNGTLTGTGQQANANTSAAQQAANTIYPKLGQVGAEWVNTVVGGATNQASGATGGAGNLSTAGNTWAGAGNNSGIAGGTDWEAIRKKIESGS